MKVYIDTSISFIQQIIHPLTLKKNQQQLKHKLFKCQVMLHYEAQ